MTWFKSLVVAVAIIAAVVVTAEYASNTSTATAFPGGN